MARLTARDSGAFAMMSFVGLASVACGGVMFQYSRVRAIPARISAIIEPEPIDGVACTPDKCDAMNPRSQWYANGRLRVKETSLIAPAVVCGRASCGTSGDHARAGVKPRRVRRAGHESRGYPRT